MQAVAHPNPFDPNLGYEIDVTGGKEPISFVPAPSPPNPPGVEVEPNGTTAHVSVAPPVPPGTTVVVVVTDSSKPAQSVPVTNHT